MTAEAAAPAAPAALPREATVASWIALGIFSVVTLFAYVDRTIFSLLAEPIRRAMGFSDLQLGLLQGTGLALFAALAYYPIGWLADRFDRRLVMVLGIAVWSSAVVACGLARGFWTLFGASALVGAGEASLAPVFYSMIPELFRGGARQVANSVFGVTAASVGGLAIVISGQLPGLAETVRPNLPGALAHLETWRLAFFAAAAPAPAMILLILTVRLGGPRREAAPAAPVRAPILPFFRREQATLIPFILGVATAQFGFAASGNWTAVILMRFFGQTPGSVGSFLGLISLAATGGGFALSILIARLWGRRLGPVLPIRALWLSYIVAALANAAMIMAPSAVAVFAIGGVGATLTTAANLLTPTALQTLAPRAVRGRFIALFFMLLLLTSAAAGPIVGLVSGQIAHLPRALLVAAGSVSAISLLTGAFLLARSERPYARTAATTSVADADG